MWNVNSECPGSHKLSVTQEAKQYITEIWKCLLEFAKSSVTLQMCALHTVKRTGSLICVSHLKQQDSSFDLASISIYCSCKDSNRVISEVHICSWTNACSSLTSLQELIFIIPHISALLSHCTHELPLFLLYFKLSGTDCLFILFPSLFLDISVKWIQNNNRIQRVSRKERSNYWTKALAWLRIAYRLHKNHLTSHWNLLLFFSHVRGLLSVKSWWQSNP